MSNDDILDDFFNDYENEQNSSNLKDFIQFFTDLSYEGKNFNPDAFEVKRIKPLRASKYIPRNGRELF